MPFQPKKSGNPNGRPKGMSEELAKFRRSVDLRDLRVALFKMATDDTAPYKDRIAAIKEWHDRAYGKSPQAITDADGGPLLAPVIMIPKESDD